MKNFEKIIPAAIVGLVLAGTSVVDAHAADIPPPVDTGNNNSVEQGTEEKQDHPQIDSAAKGENGDIIVNPGSGLDPNGNGAGGTLTATEKETVITTTPDGTNTSGGVNARGEITSVTENVDPSDIEDLDDVKKGLEEAISNGDNITPDNSGSDDSNSEDNEGEDDKSEEDNTDAGTKIGRYTVKDVAQEDGETTYTLEKVENIETELTDEEKDTLLGSLGIRKNGNGQYVDAQGRVVNVKFTDNGTSKTTTLKITVKEGSETIKGQQPGVSENSIDGKAIQDILDQINENNVVEYYEDEVKKGWVKKAVIDGKTYEFEYEYIDMTEYDVDDPDQIDLAKIADLLGDDYDFSDGAVYLNGNKLIFDKEQNVLKKVTIKMTETEVTAPRKDSVSAIKDIPGLVKKGDSYEYTKNGETVTLEKTGKGVYSGTDQNGVTYVVRETALDVSELTREHFTAFIEENKLDDYEFDNKDGVITFTKDNTTVTVNVNNVILETSENQAFVGTAEGGAAGLAGTLTKAEIDSLIANAKAEAAKNAWIWIQAQLGTDPTCEITLPTTDGKVLTFKKDGNQIIAIMPDGTTFDGTTFDGTTFDGTGGTAITSFETLIGAYVTDGVFDFNELGDDALLEYLTNKATNNDRDETVNKHLDLGLQGKLTVIGEDGTKQEQPLDCVFLPESLHVFVGKTAADVVGIHWGTDASGEDVLLDGDNNPIPGNNTKFNSESGLLEHSPYNLPDSIQVDGNTEFLEYTRKWKTADFPYLKDANFYAVIAEVGYNEYELPADYASYTEMDLSSLKSALASDLQTAIEGRDAAALAKFGLDSDLKDAIESNDTDALKKFGLDADEFEEGGLNAAAFAAAFVEGLHYVALPDGPEASSPEDPGPNRYLHVYLDSAPMTVYGYFDRSGNGCYAKIEDGVMLPATKDLEEDKQNSNNQERPHGYDVYLDNLTLVNGKVLSQAMGSSNYSTTATKTKTEGTGMFIGSHTTVTESSAKGEVYDGNLNYYWINPNITASINQARDVEVDVTYSQFTPDEDPEVEIPDEEPPLADEPEIEIPDEDVPLADEPEIEIPDVDIPLADVPQTGENLMAQMMALAAASFSVLLLVVTRKRRRS